MSVDRADATRTRIVSRERKIKLPGEPVKYGADDPLRIARELRAKSRLGRREARLAEAERKARG